MGKNIRSAAGDEESYGKSYKDAARENRIENEIIFDAYSEEERAMGWYYYLEDKVTFPFTAKCTVRRATSPLRVGEEIKVIGMASEDDCSHEICVNIQWNKGRLAVPLSQLGVTNTNLKPKEAVEDWNYWVKMGYQF